MLVAADYVVYRESQIDYRYTIHDTRRNKPYFGIWTRKYNFDF
jgi:hypothetical protein